MTDDCVVRISIAGAGVAGLTCGVVLAEKGYDVTIVASEIGVASRAAAAIWFPYDCAPEERVSAWAHNAATSSAHPHDTVNPEPPWP